MVLPASEAVKLLSLPLGEGEIDRDDRSGSGIFNLSSSSAEFARADKSEFRPLSNSSSNPDAAADEAPETLGVAPIFLRFQLITKRSSSVVGI